MAGFNFTPPSGPVPALSADLLTRLAQAGFRPPSVMAAPGVPGMSPIAAPPSFSTADGMRMLSAALAAWKARPDPAAKPAGIPAPNRYGVIDPEATQSAYPGNPATFPTTGTTQAALTLPDFWSGALLSKGGFSA